MSVDGTGSDAEPAHGQVRLTIQKMSGVPPRSSRRPKPRRGAPRRTPATSQAGHDLLTSHFELGSRGAVLAALKQRSLSAPQRREVKVQLLEPPQSGSRGASGARQGARAPSAKPGDDLSTSGGAAAPAKGEDLLQQPPDALHRQNLASASGPGKTAVLRDGRPELEVSGLIAADRFVFLAGAHCPRGRSRNPALRGPLGAVTGRSPDDPVRSGAQRVDAAANVVDPSAKTSVGTDPVTTATCTDRTREERRPRVVSVATQADDSLAEPANEAATEAGPARTEREAAAAAASALTEARQRLRQFQRQKKVLDENLETAERFRSGEILRCQLEALAANSDCSERARVKRTVDAWIHLMAKDVQDRMEEEAANRRSFRTGAADGGTSARPGRPASAPRGSGSKRTAAGRGLRSRPAAPRRAGAAAESYLTRLYGRAPRDVKSSPPLRSSSVTAAVDGKPRRPAVNNAVRGATVKPAPPPPPLLPAPARRQPPAKTPPPPVAIPLAHPRIGPSPRCQQAATSLPVASSRVEHAAPGPPATGSPVADCPPPPPLPQLSPVPVEEHEELVVESGGAPDRGPEAKPDSGPEDAAEARPASAETSGEEEREEWSGFPGTDFLSIGDVVHATPGADVPTADRCRSGRAQDPVAVPEGVAGEEALLLDGGPSRRPVVYRGPVFPPEKHAALPDPRHGSAPTLDENLLDRLVQWVEQQLMSRVISQNFPPSLDQNDRSDAEERSLASDTVEAAGGGGLEQFFVDAGICVDSPLVKELVHEVLAEIVDQVLPSVPGPGPDPESGVVSFFQEKTVPVVSVVPVVVTPLATPLPSPVPSIRDPVPFSTPPPSEPSGSPIGEAPPEAVPTPPASPEPFRLEEIRPALTPASSENDRPDPRAQSSDVQKEEEKEGPRPPSPVQAPQRAEPEPEDTDSTAGSTGDSSSTVTGSEAGLKLVSEGELLISFNHTDAIAGGASSSSSLQDVEEELSAGEVTASKVHQSGGAAGPVASTTAVSPQPSGPLTGAVLEATDGSFNYDLQSQPSRAFPFRAGRPPSGQREEGEGPSSDDSGDFF
ncbi:protein TALPID3 isoform X2 [Syngnathoides biaculeatus]|uniref:protein TALPID3 isoform X2 n=1 Tax=Syngnathoides biaculeatus TaxID=300417 RepID=UPI002ADE06E8|nr:protein TALPID3 isoform X2 [Syngnathoides biaculeatus]